MTTPYEGGAPLFQERSGSIKFDEFYYAWEPFAMEMKSWKKTKYIWTFFLEFWGDRYLHDVSTADIDRWRMMRKHQVCESSVDREFNSLAGYFRKAVEWGYLHESPCSRLRRFNKFNPRYRILNKYECEQLFDAAGKAGRRTAWVIRTMHDTGCRPGELMSLKWDQVDFTSRVFKLRSTKTRINRVIYCSPEVMSLTMQLERSSEFVCRPWPRKNLEDVVQVLDDFKLYDLRKNFISQALSNGCNIKAVSECVGSSPQTLLKHYASVPQEELRAVASRATSYTRGYRQLSLISDDI